MTEFHYPGHTEHSHADVLGIKVSAVNMAEAVNLAGAWTSNRQPGYICVTGVHGVMEAQVNPELFRTINAAAINVPDGMPMTWVGHAQGFATMDRVYGPDFMLAMCERAVTTGWRMFFYGGNDGVAQQLAANLQARFPGLQVAGSYTPPFRPLNTAEEVELAALVEAGRPDIFWVGLSTPKQEKFMAAYSERLQVPLMVGVGAAFDIHTGRIQDAPHWMKRSGLQWLHRLMQEPKRLGKRYLVNNPKFVLRISRQLLREKMTGKSAAHRAA